MNMKKHRGFLMLMALVFGSVFLMVLGALSSVTLIQNRAQNAATGRRRRLLLPRRDSNTTAGSLRTIPGTSPTVQEKKDHTCFHTTIRKEEWRARSHSLSRATATAVRHQQP